MIQEIQPINPQTKEAMMQEIYDYLGKYTDLKIETQEKYDFCAELLKQVKDRAKALEAKRKERTRPIDELKSLIISDFDQLIDPLVRFEEEVKQKMIDYIRADQKRRDEEQKKIDGAAAKRLKETGELEATVPIVNEKVKTVRTGGATTTIKENWQAIIVDEQLIPREYLTPDLKKITAAAKAGIRNVPGVRYEDKGTLAIR